MTKIRSLCELSDEKVVLLAQNGDRKALDHIVARYRNLVYTKAKPYFLIGADKDDIIQEGMIGLYKAVRDFKHQKANFKAFAGICVSRQIISAVKSATRQKHMPLNSYISLNKNVYDSEEDATLLDIISEQYPQDPESILINRENLDGIEYKISQALSKFELEVLMYYLDGRSYQEISVFVHKDVKSVDNAVQRIKKKIEVILQSRDSI